MEMIKAENENQEKVVPTIGETPDTPEVLEARKLFIEADALDAEIKSSPLANPGMIKVMRQIEMLKRELAQHLARIEVLKYDQTILGTKSDEDVKKRVENAREILALPNYIADLRKRLQIEEEKISTGNFEADEKSEKNIAGIESKDMINHEQALAWLEDIEKDNGVKYELMEIQKLQEAYKTKLEGFKKEIYLSGSEDKYSPGSVFGVDFSTGETVTRGKGRFFAVEPVESK